MQFIDIPTEQTTAVTDILLAVLAIAGAVYLHRIGENDRWKTNMWLFILAMLAIAAGLGSIAHGFQLPQALKAGLWHPIKLSLGLLVALFMVAMVYDVWGQAIARKILPAMVLIGIGFFVITLIWPDSFLVFIVYETVAMLLALGGYAWVACRRRLRGAWLMTGGILTSIVAAAVQTSKNLSFTFIWPFDHNGAYHLIQMAGVILIVAGLRRALR